MAEFLVSDAFYHSYFTFERFIEQSLYAFLFVLPVLLFFRHQCPAIVPVVEGIPEKYATGTGKNSRPEEDFRRSNQARRAAKS